MKKKLMLIMMMAVCFVFVQAQNQTDSYLQEITKVVKELRKNNNSVRNSVVTNLSQDGKPKITLMDEVQLSGDKEEKANEVKGAKGNRFKLNQVVSRVYKKQNHQLESKGNMLNGNEKDIHYSIIEKSIKRGGKVTYELKGRSGEQDFVFIPYNPKTKYVIYMYTGKKEIRKEVTDVCTIHLDGVSRKQPLKFSISYLNDKANKDLVESFAILNYNPQK
jgi:hypothetical protein